MGLFRALDCNKHTSGCYIKHRHLLCLENVKMKRYTSREQILKDINSAHAKIAKAKQIAQSHLDEEELFAGTDNASELRKCRDAADKQFRKIKRLETVRLPKLGEKLAEFDTIPLIPQESSRTELDSTSPPSSEPPASSAA